jgi:polysaccharide export outer membrane protein
VTRLFAVLIAFALAAFAQAYRLGPDDQIMVRALHVPEIPDRPIRIGADGTIQLPLVGRVTAGGLTTRALETEVARILKQYVEEPEVSVELVEQRSEPVSVLGAVKTPGTYQLRGSKTLIEVLSLAGGTDNEAGYTVRIARRLSQGALPLADARQDGSGEFTSAEVNLQQQSNLAIQPFDVITVPRAKMVYVIGEVHKPGGFVLRDTEHISVLQALALAEGMGRTAGGKGARVMRPEAADGTRQEIPVNLNDILSGKAKDQPLLAGDILFVPNSASKSAAMRTIEAAIQMATGLVIWRP